MTSLLYCFGEGIFPRGQEEYWRNSLPLLHLSWNGGGDLQTDYSYHIELPSGDIYSFNIKLLLQQMTLFIPFIPTAPSDQSYSLQVSHCHGQILLAPSLPGNIHWNPFVASLRETILEREGLLRMGDIWLRGPLSSLPSRTQRSGLWAMKWCCWFTFLSDRRSLTRRQHKNHLRVTTC